MKYILTTLYPDHRLKFIEDIKREIGTDLLIFEDKEGNYTKNVIRLLRELGDEGGVHLEDDCIVSDRLKERIQSEVDKRPHEVINFFSRRGDDLKIGSRYLAGASISYNVCYYMPPNFCNGLANYMERKHDSGEIGKSETDTTMGKYMALKGMNYWQVIPNPVDHAIGVSTIDKRRARDRSSKTFKFLDKEDWLWMQK